MNSTRDRIIILSPGRVNLLGEHVDYNDGMVLPAAIDRYVRLSAHATTGRLVSIAAHDFNQRVSFSLDQLDFRVDIQGNPLPAWALYPAGVAWALEQHGYPLNAFEAEFQSNIPIGAGLSSSAAVEVAFGLLWQTLAAASFDRLELAKICQFAENRYVGVQCGLMDQFACTCGVEGKALYLDTRSSEWRPVALPQGTVLIVADSGIRRSLATSAYNERRSDCEAAVQVLKSRLPGITALRDVSPAQFQEHAHMLPKRVALRARHIVDECARVSRSLEYLQSGDAQGLGALMFECHNSLRDFYEVSLPELDQLVEISAGLPGCLGARLTGAGFGGCTVNLVEESAANQFTADLAVEYRRRTGRQAAVYLCRASQGVHLVDNYDMELNEDHFRKLQ